MNNLFSKILEQNKFVLMAEIKMKSPIEGKLGSMENIEQIALEYKKGGADVISVVTAKKYFDGSLEMITRVKQTVDLPVFVKDFVTSEKQIREIKKKGADAVLLLANFVSKEKLKQIYKKAEDLGLIPVVEVDNEDDLNTAVDEKYSVIAINARNLKDFSVDRNRAINLLKMIPKNIIPLAFSGVKNKEGAVEYLNAGAKGILVGTALMKSENKIKSLKELRKI